MENLLKNVYRNGCTNNIELSEYASLRSNWATRCVRKHQNENELENENQLLFYDEYI